MLEDREPIAEAITEHFDLRPGAIIETFGLRQLPQQRGGRFYQDVAAYGHFGREDEGFTWELTDKADELREEVELVRGASHEFDIDAYLRGELSPVFFGSAINNFGVEQLLDAFAAYAPGPQPRETLQRKVALKAIRAGRGLDPVARERFLREARAAAAVLGISRKALWEKRRRYGIG